MGRLTTTTWTAAALPLSAIVLTAIVVSLAPPAAAQTTGCETPGPDAGGYVCDVIAYNFQDIRSTGTAVTLTDDSVSSAIPLGFTFDFYNGSYTSVHISSNGFLLFEGSANGCCSGQPVPSTTEPNALVAGYWSDLNPSAGGQIHYRTVGTSPDRAFIAQFTAVPHYSFGGANTFQMVLRESGSAEVHFQSVTTDGGTMTTGIENQEGAIGLRYAYGSYSASSVGVSFHRGAPVTTATVSGTAGNDGWHLSDVSVALSCTPPPGSACGSSFWRLDGGAWNTYTGAFPVTGDGTHTVDYYSRSTDGIDESTRHLTLQIDTRDPTSAHALAGTAGDNGWWISDVDVTLTASDAGGSGAAGTRFRVDNGTWTDYSGSFRLSQQGRRFVEHSAVDVAGNEETPQGVSIPIDREGPTVGRTFDGTQGARGWYRTPVTVTLSGADAASGVRSLEHRLDGGAWTTYSTQFSISAEGNHTFERRGTDNAGWTNAYNGESLAIDLSQPSATASVTGDQRGGWYVTTAYVAIGASDSLSGVEAVYVRVDGGAWSRHTGTIAIDEDGTHLVEFYAVDYAGNVGPTGSVTVPVDRTPPTASHTITGANGANGWYQSNVTVALVATDGTSGLATLEYSVDDGPWQPYAGSFPIAGEGRHVLRYRAVDAAGWETTRHVPVDIDLNDPSATHALSGTLGEAGWYRSTVTLTLTTDDGGGSGVAAREWRPNGSAWSSPTWSAYTGPVSTDRPGDHHIEYRVTDASGRVVSGAATFRLDNVAPSTTPSVSGARGPNGYYRDPSVLVSATATDAHSGVASLHERTDNGAWTPYTAPFRVSGEGGHTVLFYATDVAGNEQTPIGVSFTIDSQPPRSHAGTTGLRGGDGWFVAPVLVNLSASDETARVASLQYRIDGGPVRVYLGPFLVEGEGVHLVEHWATDTTGNEEAPRPLLVPIDMSAPTTSADVVGPQGDDGSYTAPPTITLSASDAHAGVASTHYRIDGGETRAYDGPFTTADGAHAVEYWSIDLAGHTESPKVLALRVDTLGPESDARFTGVQGNDGWFRSPVAVDLSSPDATASLHYRLDDGPEERYLAPFVVADDGEHALLHYARDAAGNVGIVTGETLRIDTQAPTSAADVSGDAGDDSWFRSPVSVALHAVDGGSGVRGIQYSVDGGAFAAYEGPFTLATPGEHEVQFFAEDGAGNVEALQRVVIRLDFEAPATEVVIAGAPEGGDGWITGAAVVHLLAQDAHSGVARTEYRVNGGPWSTYATPIPIASDEIHLVEFASVDAAGNAEAVQGVTVARDAQAPAVQAALDPAAPDGNDGWYVSPPTLSVEATDATSGVAATYYGRAGADAEEPTTTRRYTGPTLLPEGRWTVNATARDHAGNEGRAAATIAYAYDGTAPVANATLAGTPDRGSPNGYRSSVNITISAEDAGAPRAPAAAGGASADVPVTGSGVRRVMYSLDGAPFRDYTGTITVTGGGAHTLRYHAEDVAGNVQPVQTRAFHVYPEHLPNLGFVLNDNANYTRSLDVAIRWTSTPANVVAVTCSHDDTLLPPPVPFAPEMAYRLTDGKGTKRVFCNGIDAHGGTVARGSDDITYQPVRAFLSHTDGVSSTNGWYRTSPRFHLEGEGSAEGSDYAGLTSLHVVRDGADTEMDVLYVDEMSRNTVGAWRPSHTPRPQEPGRSYSVTELRQGLESIVFTYHEGATAAAQAPPHVRRDFPSGLDLSRYDALALWVLHQTSGENTGNSPADAAELSARLRVTLNPPSTQYVFEANLSTGVWTPLVVGEATGLPDTLTSIQLSFLQDGDDSNPQQIEEWYVDGIKAFCNACLTEDREGEHVWQARAVDGYVDPLTAERSANTSAPEIVRVDRTAPKTAARITPDGHYTFYPDSVTVEIVADDRNQGASPPPNRVSGIERIQVQAPVEPFAIDQHGEGAPIASTSFTLTRDGEHVIRFTSNDTAGNADVEHLLNITIDRLPPDVLITVPADPARQTTWYNHNVSLVLSARDAGSGVRWINWSVDNGTDVARHSHNVTTAREASAEVGFLLVEDGVHRIEAYAVDYAGRRSALGTTVVRIDTVPGETDARLTSNRLGEENWYRAPVNVTLVAEDGLSGIDEIRYRLDDDIEQRVKGNRTTIHVDADGEHRLVFRSQDNATNNESPRELPFRLDQRAPATEARLPPMRPDELPYGWYHRNVTVTLNASDRSAGAEFVETSGVRWIGYRIDGGDLVTTETEEVPVAFEADGDYNLTFHALDRAGNEETARSVQVRLDRLAPTSTLATEPAAPDGENGWFVNPVSVRIDASDQVSGVARIWYAVDGDLPLVVDVHENVTSAGFEIVGDGNHTIVFFAEDHAGNREEPQTYEVRIDRSAPFLARQTIGAKPFEWFVSNVTLAAHALDEKASARKLHWSGADAVRIEITPADESLNVVTSDPEADALGRELDAPGPSALARIELDNVYTVRWSGSDRAGNRVNLTEIVKIDQLAPDTDATLTPEGAPAGDNGWFRSPVRVTLTADDTNPRGVPTSGVARTVYTIDGGPSLAYEDSFVVTGDGDHVVTFFSVDHAGNVEPVKTTAFGIDTQAPIVSAQAVPPVASGNDGWYRHADRVDVVVAAADTLSGVATTTSGGGAAAASASDGGSDTGRAPPARAPPAGAATTAAVGQGIHPIGGTATDMAGNQGGADLVVKIDTLAPVTTRRILAPDGQEGRWYRGPVTVNLTAADVVMGGEPSGVKHILYSLDGAPLAMHDARTPLVLTVTQDGNHTLVYFAEDVAGNAEAATLFEFNIDARAPEATVVVAPLASASSDGEWFASNVTLQVTGRDDNPHARGLRWSGVWTADLSVSPPDADVQTTTPEPREVPPELADADPPGPVSVAHLSLDNVYTVTWSGTDRAGHPGGWTQTIRIDKLAPRTAAELEGVEGPANENGWFGSSVRVRLAASDENPRGVPVSGVASTMYSVDGGEATAYGEPFVVTGDGEHVVTFYSVDRAGNVETLQTTSFGIDTTAPEIRRVLLPAEPTGADGWYRHGDRVDIAATATDRTSGVEFVSVVSQPENGGAGMAAQSGTDNGRLPPLRGLPAGAQHASAVGQGIHQVSVTAMDRAGKVALDAFEIKVDTIAPESSLYVNAPRAATADGWYRDAVVVVIEAGETPSDVTVSEVREIRYKVDRVTDGVRVPTIMPTNATGATTQFAIDETGEYEITYWALDRAGNEEEKKTRTVRIDITAPLTECLAPLPSRAVGQTVALTPDMRWGECTQNRWFTSAPPIRLRALDDRDEAQDDDPLPADARQSGVQRIHYRWYAMSMTDDTSGWGDDRKGPFLVAEGPETMVEVGYDPALQQARDGNYTLEWFAEDATGNLENVRALVVRVDSVRPRIFDETPANDTRTDDLFAAVGARFSDDEGPNPSGIARRDLVSEANGLAKALQNGDVEGARKVAEGLVNEVPRPHFVQLTINGRDYTPLAQVQEDQVVYDPREDGGLPWVCNELNRVELFVGDEAGNGDTKIWYFTVECVGDLPTLPIP